MSIFKRIFQISFLGNRKIQEDNFVFLTFQDQTKENFESVFIFDGHGARNQDESLPDFLINNHFLQNQLNSFFNEKLVSITNLMIFFDQLDKNILPRFIKLYTGSCFSGIIYDKQNQFFFILTLGDTRITIFNSNKKLLYETSLHNCNNQEEYKRIKIKKKENCIKNGRYKGLAMTRSIGDFDCKDEYNDPLTAIPEIKKIPNNKNLIFLLHTDGFDCRYNKQKILNYYEQDFNKLKTYCNSVNDKNIVLSQTENGKTSTNIVDNTCIIVFSNFDFNTKSLDDKQKIQQSNIDQINFQYAVSNEKKKDTFLKGRKNVMKNFIFYQNSKNKLFKNILMQLYF